MCGAHAVWLCPRDQGYVLLGDTLLFGGDTCWDTTLSKHMGTCSGALTFVHIYLYITPDSNTGVSLRWRWQLVLNQYTLANTLLAGHIGVRLARYIFSHIGNSGLPGCDIWNLPYCFSKCGMTMKGTQVEMRVKKVKTDFIACNSPANFMIRWNFFPIAFITHPFLHQTSVWSERPGQKIYIVCRVPLW